jgi:hypothetical protein
VNRVKTLGLGAGHVDQLHGDDLQTVGLDAFDDFADDAAADAIRFYDC